MVRSREEALKDAQATTHNTVGACQLYTRNYYGAPSAGDQDRDGDADAVDGWASEPVAARHPGDRNPPAGVPVRFAGGSHGYGHSCISNGKPNGGVRSTDMSGDRYAPGVTSDTSIAAIEQHMNQRLLGWSETIDGEPIPYDNKPVSPTKPQGPRKPHTPPRLTKVTRAQRLTERAAIRAKAKGQTARAAALFAALAALRKAGK